MVEAGLNLVPTALVVLSVGVGAVVLAVASRAASAAVYAAVAWSLLVDLIASLVDGVRWLEHTSLYHYMALALALLRTPPPPFTADFDVE